MCLFCSAGSLYCLDLIRSFSPPVLGIRMVQSKTTDALLGVFVWFLLCACGSRFFPAVYAVCYQCVCYVWQCAYMAGFSGV